MYQNVPPDKFLENIALTLKNSSNNNQKFIKYSKNLYNNNYNKLNLLKDTQFYNGFYR